MGGKDGATGPEAQQWWGAGTELCQPQLLQQPRVLMVIWRVTQSHVFLLHDSCEAAWKGAIWLSVWCEARMIIVLGRRRGKEPSKEDTQKSHFTLPSFTWL